MQETKHTPVKEKFEEKLLLPLYLDEDDRNYGVSIRDAKQNLIAVPADQRPYSVNAAKEFRELIVKAVNSHHSLVEVLKTIQHVFSDEIDFKLRIDRAKIAELKDIIEQALKEAGKQ